MDIKQLKYCILRIKRPVEPEMIMNLLTNDPSKKSNFIRNSCLNLLKTMTLLRNYSVPGNERTQQLSFIYSDNLYIFRVITSLNFPVN